MKSALKAVGVVIATIIILPFTYSHFILIG